MVLVRSCWGPLWLAYHEDIWSSQWSKPPEIHWPPFVRKIRACSDILSNAVSRRPHLSHCSRVLQRCHPEQSSCSSEFGCHSFIKHSTWTVCFLLVMWKNLCVFMSHNSAKFQWTFHFDSDWLIIACFMRVWSIMMTLNLFV